MNTELWNGEAGRLFAPVTLLAFLSLFVVSFILIGLPLGHLLGVRRARRELAHDLRRPRVDHVPKLGEDRMPLVVNLAAKLCVGYRLLFLKSKLLLQQALLKTIGQTTRQPSTEQCAESDAPSPSKENFVCHSDVRMQANDQAEARRERDP